MDSGAPDEPSREELANRVAELEQTVSKMLPDRRGVLKGLGAAAVGGAAVGGATGGASGQSAAGQVGTESEPVDVEGAQGNFDSVSTEELNNTLYTSNRDGQTSHEKIQNALDLADSTVGWTRVVIDGHPDSLPAEADADEGYVISQSLEVGDWTIVENRSYVFLESGSDDNLLRNKAATSGDTTRNYAHILKGEGIWDGNASNQTTFNREGGSAQLNIGLRFWKVDRLKVEDARVRNTNGWGVKIEDGKWWNVDDLDIDQDGSTPNQDGVHLIGPAQHATVSDITGRSGDDLVAVNCDDPDDFNEGSGGFVNDITIDSPRGTTAGPYSIVRVWGESGGNGYQLRNVDVNDVVGENVGDVVRIGFGQSSNPPEGVNNVTVDGVTGRDSDVLIDFEGDCDGVELSDLSADGVRDLIKQQPDVVTENVTVDGARHDNNGDGGATFAFDGDGGSFKISDVEVAGVAYVFSGYSQSHTGHVRDIAVDNVITAVYRSPSDFNFKVTGDMPSFNAAPAHVEGSEVIATAAWDPDGDGNGEKVISDGANWNEIADMPNI